MPKVSNPTPISLTLCSLSWGKIEEISFAASLQKAHPNRLGLGGDINCRSKTGQQPTWGKRWHRSGLPRAEQKWPWTHRWRRPNPPAEFFVTTRCKRHYNSSLAFYMCTSAILAGSMMVKLVHFWNFLNDCKQFWHTLRLIDLPLSK